MPRSRVTIIAEGQVVEVEGTTPSIQTSTIEAKVVFSAADGRVVSSTIRAMQERHDIQSLQTPPGAWILLQKAG